MVLERPDVSEGTLKLPDDPGIGLDIDRSFVEEHAIDL
jgi:L-alanine-DL-glutamate epimerase-like enolase superfamily enzyme